MPYFQSKYDPDPLRYYLTATTPETRDTEACPEGFEGFSWEDFVGRNNPVPSRSPEQREGASEGKELVATARLSSRRSLGNLANRMLSVAHKRFDGRVPEPGDFDAEDRAILEKVEAGFQIVGDLYAACKPHAALGEAMELACEANGYSFATLSAGLGRKAPWCPIKEDPQAAATTVYVIVRVVDNLKTILAPILPHTAQRLHEYLSYDGQPFGTQHVAEYEEETRSHQALTYDHTGAIGTWTKSELPAPLFKKLDESVVEEEHAQLER